MKKICELIFVIVLSITCKQAQAQYLGANFVNYETYTDSISNEWVIACYQPGDTMSFRLRGEAEKGFKSVLPYIAFKNQAAAKGITVKFMYCVDSKTTAQINFDRIKAMKDAGCFVPDVELFNEFYANDPDGTKGTCKFDFNCYKSKAEPIINLVKATYPNMRFFFCLAPNRGRSDQTRWNNAVKDYIQNNPLYNVTYHLYYNSQDCPILADSLIPQIVTSAYNSYLDNRYSTMRNQLFSSSLLSQTQSYLSTDFTGKLVAYTEIGIIGGDPDRGSTSNIRNTFVYAEWIYLLLNEIKAYEVDIHSGVSLTGIIQPTSKFDITDAFKNKKRYEYYSLSLHRDLGAKPGVSFLPIGEEPFLQGYTPTVLGYNYVSSPYYYSSVGGASFFKNGSPKQYTIPLKTDPVYSGKTFGYQVVNFVPACYDTTYFVNDTSYTTIQVANPVPAKCSRFFYSLFHSKECTVTYHNEQKMIITRKEITETICN